MADDSSTLGKLKIQAFDSAKRTKKTGEFEVMFNPASYSQTHRIPWSKSAGLNQSGQSLQYTGSTSGEISLDLVLDGTGVDQLGAPAAGSSTVEQRVQSFFDVTLKLIGKIHQPNYLRITWGSLNFDCRLSTVTINYTAFARNGKPLRAELKTQFLADDEPEKRAKTDKLKSPDLTHSRIVRSGDTLPLLTKDVYGSPDSYLEVARFNGLDDFRRLTPGQELHFPPLVQLIGPIATGQR